MRGDSLSIGDSDYSLTARLLRVLHLDTYLFIGLLLLTMAGMAILYSAGNESMTIILRQALHLMLAFIVMVVIAQVSPHQFYLWSPWIFGLGICLLIMVLVAGDVGKGAQRWLDLGIVRFQPSEMMKLATPMMIAWYFSEKALPPSFKVLLISTLLVLLPTALIIKQPDLGTALLIAAAGFFVVFLGGVRWRVMLASVIGCTVLFPLLWRGLHEYQRQRIMTFFNPESDPLGAGYHIIQSKIAIGSGGIYGKGWLNGTQSQLDFLPERSTDFIFSVFAEEFGMMGAVVLLSIYVFIILRALQIATQAQDTYGRLLAGSLGLTFFVYLFVNVGMVSGILPVVGVPLPLISYGGTSLVTLMAGFGMLMSINSHKRLISK